MGKKVILYSLLLMLQALAGCKHKDLYMGHDSSSTLILQVNWHLEWNIEYLIDWETEWNPEWIMDWSKVTLTFDGMLGTAEADNNYVVRPAEFTFENK